MAHTWTGEPHKHSQVTWFPVEQVPTEFVSTTREALVNYLQGGPMVSTDGFY